MISKFSEQRDQISIQSRTGEKLELEVYSLKSCPSKSSVPLEEHNPLDEFSRFKLKSATLQKKPSLEDREQESRVLINDDEQDVCMHCSKCIKGVVMKNKD